MKKVIMLVALALLMSSCVAYVSESNGVRTVRGIGVGISPRPYPRVHVGVWDYGYYYYPYRHHHHHHHR